MNIAEKFSGVIINQNQPPLSSIPVDGDWAYQEFYLPIDYKRGTDDNEMLIPALSGGQVLVAIDEGYAAQATLDFIIQINDVSNNTDNWVDLGSGMAIGAHADGDRVWMDLFLDSPIRVFDNTLSSKYRIGIRGRITSEDVQDVPVAYDGEVAHVDDFPVEVILSEHVAYPIVKDGVQGFLLLSDNAVTYSTQRGINAIWFTRTTSIGTQASWGGGEIRDPITNDMASLNFRILGLTADEGVDFLGNQFRSVVVTKDSDSIDITDPTTNNTYWLSKPNPSRFAVESRYFDLGEEKVIDHVLIDPITPGMFFHIYYSNEGDPGRSDTEWDLKFWDRVPHTYRLNERTNFALPEPVHARYFKVEFCSLQAKPYTPGDFELPITYKKHPKWVLDFFLKVNPIQAPSDLVDSSGVIFDTLDLAYNYYLDDLHQEPNAPITLDPSRKAEVSAFLNNRSDYSDKADPATLQKINLSTNIYDQTNMGNDAPRESLQYAVSDPQAITTLGRDAIVYEDGLPAMFFFVSCRHAYREIESRFSFDRAYFAGIQEISFFRQNYTVASDTDLYIDSAFDLVNVQTNEFTRDGDLLVV